MKQFSVGGFQFSVAQLNKRILVLETALSKFSIEVSKT